jgi:uncharacterized protein involved in response to NO
VSGTTLFQFSLKITPDSRCVLLGLISGVISLVSMLQWWKQRQLSSNRVKLFELRVCAPPSTLAAGKNAADPWLPQTSGHATADTTMPPPVTVIYTWCATDLHLIYTAVR